MHKYTIFIVFFFLPFISNAQLVNPEGKFLEDSMKVGEQVPYVLTVKYPEGKTIVFPDTSYNFTPFELVYKRISPTQSADGYSTDSVIYYLRSFEIQPYQIYRLPVFSIEGSDSLAIFAREDTVFLKDVEVAPNDPLKETTDYREVDLNFNYPYLFAFLGLLFCIIIAVLLIFGKKIRRKIKLYRLRKAHQKFINQYENLIEKLAQTNSKSSAEAALNFWRRYMEKLEKIPYMKLTTKEVSTFHPDEDFIQTLKSLDRSIYGRYHNEEVQKSMIFLEEYANERYEEKVEEVNKNE